MADIYLSYAPADAGRAHRVAGALRRRGWSVADEPESITGARCVVVLWSRASKYTSRVRDDAVLAHADGRLVAGFLDDVQPPYELRGTTGARLAGRHPAVGELAMAVAVTLAGGPPWFDMEERWRLEHRLWIAVERLRRRRLAELRVARWRIATALAAAVRSRSRGHRPLPPPRRRWWQRLRRRR